MRPFSSFLNMFEILTEKSCFVNTLSSFKDEWFNLFYFLIMLENKQKAAFLFTKLKMVVIK